MKKDQIFELKKKAMLHRIAQVVYQKSFKNIIDKCRYEVAVLYQEKKISKTTKKMINNNKEKNEKTS